MTPTYTLHRTTAHWCIVAAFLLWIASVWWAHECGATDEQARHAESLRHLLPITEAALEAHRVELEALLDTIDSLEGVRMEDR